MQIIDRGRCGRCDGPLNGRRGRRASCCGRCRARGLAAANASGVNEHSTRVADLAVQIAQRLELDADAQYEVELVALLHDLGKTGISRRILEKPAPLDDHEWASMREHTVMGERMLRVIEGLPEGLGALVRATHERFDGAGYPDGLGGWRIPLSARIVFVADSYDAMTSERPYRRPLPVPVALEELRVGAGRQFDPEVALALVDIIESRLPLLAISA